MTMVLDVVSCSMSTYNRIWRVLIYWAGERSRQVSRFTIHDVERTVVSTLRGVVVACDHFPILGFYHLLYIPKIEGCLMQYSHLAAHHSSMVVLKNPWLPQCLAQSSQNHFLLNRSTEVERQLSRRPVRKRQSGGTNLVRNSHLLARSPVLVLY